MATLLAHIRVYPGKEVQYEAVSTALHRATHANEPNVRRYECWRGAEAGTYYTLLSFDDYLGFLNHQTAPTTRRPVRGSEASSRTCASNWVDPIQGVVAPRRDEQPAAARRRLRARNADYEQYACVVQEWWQPLRPTSDDG